MAASTVSCWLVGRSFPAGRRSRGSAQRRLAPDEWFPVAMDYDPLSPESAIDVGYLIDAPAGEHGFLKRDGKSLRFEGADRPVKFWAVNSSVKQDWTPSDMEHAARWIRKHGVNLVRQHTMIDAIGLMDASGRLDPQRLDRYDRWFAELKKQGIYSAWSVVYPHHGRFLQRHDVDPALFAELDNADQQADGGHRPIAVNDFINLDSSLQQAAWKYFDALLNHVNPYTELAYKDDPALAVLEFQNESNVFFFTLNVLLEDDRVPTLSRRMRRAFFEFVKNKYGSREATAQAWNDRWQRGDDWDAGELKLMGAHHWGADGPLYEYEGQTRRAGDYIAFLTELQRGYYERRERQVRQTGFEGVTVTTAWRSGGPAASMANLYADTAADMIDRHNYFGGGDGGHAIVEGKVNNETHLSQPGHGLLNLALFQVADRPFCVSELLQMAPNPWKAEAAPLYTFYGMGLQGWDAVYSFALGSRRMGDGWHRLGKYVVETPHYFGQFPALAYAVHNGHIQEGAIVADRRVSRKAMFSGTDPLGQSLSGGGYDDKRLSGRLSTPAWAVAIGRTTIAFDDGDTTLSDLTPYHDERRRTLSSTTGELIWRYGDRIVEVRTPKTQAVIGFAGGNSVDLPSVAVETSTPFVSLIFTPLDNLELNKSRRILITAMARDRQTGALYNDDSTELLKVGRPPLLMEPVQATIRLQGSHIQQVRPLDFYGVPRGDNLPISRKGSFRIGGMYRTYYYLAER